MNTIATPFRPSPELVQAAWDLVTHERSRLVALSIALSVRMEDRERCDETDSTEMLLAQLLAEHISSTEVMNVAYGMLTGT